MTVTNPSIIRRLAGGAVAGLVLLVAGSGADAADPCFDLKGHYDEHAVAERCTSPSRRSPVPSSPDRSVGRNTRSIAVGVAVGGGTAHVGRNASGSAPTTPSSAPPPRQMHGDS